MTNDHALKFVPARKHVAIRAMDGHDEPYLFVDTPDGLMTCVQMGTIEFHGWGARVEDVEKELFRMVPRDGIEPPTP